MIPNKIINLNILDKGIASGFICPVLRHLLALIINLNYRRFHWTCSTTSHDTKRSLKSIKWGGTELYYFDPSSLISNLAETFVNEVHDFGPLPHTP